jgi:hypothetical protein
MIRSCQGLNNLFQSLTSHGWMMGAKGCCFTSLTPNLPIMKKTILIIATAALAACSNPKPGTKELSTPVVSKKLFLDVHNLEPGKVKFADVAGAHAKDLATQDKYDVSFIKYWVDEAAGKVYCLAQAPDSAAVYTTHKEAHGLTPDRVELVTDGPEAKVGNANNLYLDIHRLGAGKVTAKAVADAHTKDLATQEKYGVNFINYWVDEKSGTVMCLSEAKDPSFIIKTHTEAHGLVPDEVHKVQQGN